MGAIPRPLADRRLHRPQLDTAGRPCKTGLMTWSSCAKAADSFYTLQVEEYIRRRAAPSVQLDTFAGQGGVVLKLKPSQDIKNRCHSPTVSGLFPGSNWR